MLNNPADFTKNILEFNIEKLTEGQVRKIIKTIEELKKEERYQKLCNGSVSKALVGITKWLDAIVEYGTRKFGIVD